MHPAERVHRGRSKHNFGRVLGLAAILDAIDRARDIGIDADAFRAPVSILGADAPTPTLMPAVAVGLGLFWLIGGALLTVGSVRLQRAGAIGVLIGSGAALIIDQQLFANHTWLLWSLSGLIVLGDRAKPELTVRSQISIVYLFAALSKLRSPWLDGDILRRSADGVLGLTVARDLSEPGLVGLAFATIAVEMVLAVIIWSERPRTLAVALATGFHVGVILVVGVQLGLAVFALAMLSHFFLPPRELLQPVST